MASGRSLVPAFAASLQVSWPKSAQWTAAFLLAVVSVLLGYHALVGMGLGNRPSAHQAADGPLYRLDLNRARAAELMQVPGIGPQLAQRIIDQRGTQGLFRNLDDLRQVNGIGPKTLERIRPWLCVDSKVVPAEDPAAAVNSAKESAGPPATRALTKKETALAGAQIDINQASVVQLQKLPRIGPKLSERIVAQRSKAPFLSVNDLRRVKGIGPKTLETLRPHVKVAVAPGR